MGIYGKRRLRSLAAFGLGIIWYVLCTCLTMIVAFLIPRRPIINHYYGKLLAGPMLPILGFKIRPEGFHHFDGAEPCVVVANHQSTLDLFIYGTLTRRKTVYIGKVELLWIPFFGWFFWAAGNILIKRENRSNAIKGLDLASNAMHKRKVNIWVFPEGTRNRGRALLLPFKKGAFHMAIRSGRPLVAMVSEPLENYYDYKNKLIQPGVIRVRVLPPYETHGLSDADVSALAQRVRNDMLTALEQMRQELPGKQ